MTEPDLQTNVQAWLRAQGYPLEMRTAQAFGRRGWFVHHSRRYKDPLVGKEREIDLLAFNDDPATASPIHGHFVIECKWTPKKPWVLFTAAQRSLTTLGYFHSTPMTRTVAQAVKCLVSEDVSGFPLFSSLEEGYAIVQTLRSSDAIDVAYSAVQAVVSAAEFFADQMSESTEHSIVYVPTVILDGELFLCSLAESGDVAVRKIDMGFLIHHSASDFPRCVHIVRESAVDMFIDRADMTFKSLRISLRKRQANPSISRSSLEEAPRKTELRKLPSSRRRRP